jgi:Zn-dependent peptidase ImmA (M78 family)/transcriptional regulator with XRE-family HTH domain
VPPGTFVPVTPSVVKWAVEHSGYTLDALALAIGVSPEALRAWATGQLRPKLGELRKLASQLDRPLATFLLPEPPQPSLPPVEFRSLPKSGHRSLYPVELLRLREAARLQRILAWIMRELQYEKPTLPSLRNSADPVAAAAKTRVRLGISSERQQGWHSSSAALRDWRAMLENSGVFVLMLPLGDQACRGFSLWDDYAPLIAANTTWNPEARIFTLFHEYGHVLTRTPSACVDGSSRPPSKRDDPTERWCERFASSVILPPEDLRRYLLSQGWRRGQNITQLEVVRGAARHFKASLRATTISLIELGVADSSLYGALPHGTDGQHDGGGGAGRSRTQIKRDQYGGRTFETFSSALRREVVSHGDVLDYLDVPPEVLGVGSAEIAEND